jgi:hypothetical protein
MFKYFLPCRKHVSDSDLESDLQTLRIILREILSGNLIGRQLAEKDREAAQRRVVELQREVEEIEDVMRGEAKWCDCGAGLWRRKGFVEDSEVALRTGVVEFEVRELWRRLWLEKDSVSAC